jgi:hypothetical protein
MKKYNRLFFLSFYLFGFIIFMSCQNNSSGNTNAEIADSTSQDNKLGEIIMLPSNDYRIYVDGILNVLPNKYRKAQNDSENEASEGEVIINLVGNKDYKEEDFSLGIIAKQVYSENDSIKMLVIVGISNLNGAGGVSGWCDAVLLYSKEDQWHVLSFLNQVGGFGRYGQHGNCNGFIQNGPNSILAEVEGGYAWSGENKSDLSLVGVMNNRIKLVGSFLTAWGSQWPTNEISCSIVHKFKKGNDSYLDLELQFNDELKNKKDEKKYPFIGGKYNIPDWPFGNSID